MGELTACTACASGACRNVTRDSGALAALRLPAAARRGKVAEWLLKGTCGSHALAVTAKIDEGVKACVDHSVEFGTAANGGHGRHSDRERR